MALDREAGLEERISAGFQQRAGERAKVAVYRPPG
jgi:hypothetical protein